MSAFISPRADDAANPGVPMLIVLFALLVLLFEQVLATNVSTPGHRRLSGSLDVGIAPLGMASLILAATQLALLLGRAA